VARASRKRKGNQVTVFEGRGGVKVEKMEGRGQASLGGELMKKDLGVIKKKIKEKT